MHLFFYIRILGNPQLEYIFWIKSIISSIEWFLYLIWLESSWVASLLQSEIIYKHKNYAIIPLSLYVKHHDIL